MGAPKPNESHHGGQLPAPLRCKPARDKTTNNNITTGGSMSLGLAWLADFAALFSDNDTVSTYCTHDVIQ